MRDLTESQRIQEAEYSFPYHYLPQWNQRSYFRPGVRSLGYQYLSYLMFVQSLVLAHGESEILDVGCGDGRFLYNLHKEGIPAERLTGVDCSERAILFARAFAPHIRWVCGDIETTSLVNTRYNIVTLIDVLEHVAPEKCAGFVQALHALTQEDGVLILTVPSINMTIIPKHYRHFEPDLLRQTLWPYYDLVHLHWLNRRMTWLVSTMLRLFWIPAPLCRLYFRHSLRSSPRRGTRIAAVCRRRT